MRSRILTRIIAMTVFVVLAAPIRLSAQDQQQQHTKQTHYFVKELGTLGGTFSDAEGINNRGWLVGEATVAGDTATHAALWRNDTISDLGTLGGANSSNAPFPTINNRGLIVGEAETSAIDPFAENYCLFNTNHICQGFIWKDGVMTALPTLSGGNNARAGNVNNRGQVVGDSENGVLDPTCVPQPNNPAQVFDYVPVIWDKGEVHELPLLPGDDVGEATSINDRGQVVGASGLCSSPFGLDRAVIWQGGKVTYLGSLGGVHNDFPFDINSRGQVVGFSGVAGDTTAISFLWERGVMASLGTLPGDASSAAFAINEQGQVVGTSCADPLFNGCGRAYIWEHGVMTDLNTLVKPGSTSLYLVFGNDINSRGEIAGFAFDQSNGEFRAFLATPCDEQHAVNEGCTGVDEGRTPVANATGERRKVILPENVREQLRKRLGFGRVGLGQ